jgi:hypothetical protein
MILWISDKLGHAAFDVITVGNLGYTSHSIYFSVLRLLGRTCR